MTPEQTQELKTLLCKWCSFEYPVMLGTGRHMLSRENGGEFERCTANPAVIEWVEKQLEIAKGASR